MLCRDEVKVLLVLWMKIHILDGHLINVQLAQALTSGILLAMWLIRSLSIQQSSTPSQWGKLQIEGLKSTNNRPHLTRGRGVAD